MNTHGNTEHVCAIFSDCTKRTTPASKTHQEAISSHEQLLHRRIINALMANRSGDFSAWHLGLKIGTCTSKKPCNHPLCAYCRQKQQQKASEDVKHLFKDAKGDDLLFVTILFPITYDLDDISRSTVNAYKRQWRNLMNDHAKKDKRYAGITWWGAFEVDVKRPSCANNDRTQRILHELGMDFGKSDLCYLPHLHLITNINGISKEEFRQTLERLWSGFYQVRVQRLHQGKSQEENLSTLASYVTKYRVQYSVNLDTGRDDGKADTGEYKRTQYKDLYEPDLIRQMAHFFAAAGKFDGLTYKTQMGKRKSKKHHPKPSVSLLSATIKGSEEATDAIKEMGYEETATFFMNGNTSLRSDSDDESISSDCISSNALVSDRSDCGVCCPVCSDEGCICDHSCDGRCSVEYINKCGCITNYRCSRYQTKYAKPQQPLVYVDKNSFADGPCRQLP